MLVCFKTRISMNSLHLTKKGLKKDKNNSLLTGGHNERGVWFDNWSKSFHVSNSNLNVPLFTLK